MNKNNTCWSKANWTILIPFLVFAIAFIIHYYLVINFYENLYQFHSQEVRDEIINNEKLIFNINLIGNSLLFLFIIIGTILSLNIGFILFRYEFIFKEICIVVLKSSIIFAIVYLVLPIIMYFETDIYTFEKLYNTELNFSFAKYLPNFSPIWLSNFLESFSITQLVYVAFLIVGIKNITNWNYKKSTINVIKIYGIGFLLAHGFALIMDVNFHQ